MIFSHLEDAVPLPGQLTLHGMTKNDFSLMYSRSKKKGTPLLIPIQIENRGYKFQSQRNKTYADKSINADYCLLQFDALNFSLGVRLHGESLANFNYFNVPQI